MKGKYDYTNSFNKENYKMYPFRVRKDDIDLIMKLDNVPNRNKYISSLIRKDLHPDVLTIKEIRTRIKPVMAKHNIQEVYLFGSYSRGEANPNSDVDLFCERGDVETLFQKAAIIRELEEALGKKVDFITIGSTMDDYFKEQLQEDMLRI